MQFECPKCKVLLVSDEVTEGMLVACPECGETFECHPQVTRVKVSKVRTSGGKSKPTGGDSKSMHDKVASAIGIEKLKGFKLSELFAEVFSKHSREEVENYFTTGTEKSTPDILEVDVAWPKPWLFMRMMIASLILFFLFWAGWKQFGNPRLLPGLMMVGSFAIPISTLVLFMELNVRRNVSLYMVARLAFLGGIFSLLIASVLFRLDGGGLGAMSAGPIEEPAKVLAVALVARGVKYKYKLNGLLFGAAVGVGFAVFESMGYALDWFVGDTIRGMFEVADKARDLGEAQYFGTFYGADAMISVIVRRGILSPLGHIVWSAIAGCALWRVMDGQKFQWRMLCDKRFIRLFLVPVILHMIWNSPIDLPYYGKFVLVGVVGWFVCLSLVQEGLHEIAAEKSAAKEQQALTNNETVAGEGE